MLNGIEVVIGSMLQRRPALHGATWQAGKAKSTARMSRSIYRQVRQRNARDRQLGGLYGEQVHLLAQV